MEKTFDEKLLELEQKMIDSTTNLEKIVTTTQDISNQLIGKKNEIDPYVKEKLDEFDGFQAASNNNFTRINGLFETLQKKMFPTDVEQAIKDFSKVREDLESKVN